jgi:hypothetical protein
MRTVTTNEITDIVFLINKARELKAAHSLSIRTLMHLQAQADTYYDLILSDAIVHQANLIDPLEKACDIFDELVEEYRHSEYINDLTTHWLNGEYVALPDTISRSK